MKSTPIVLQLDQEMANLIWIPEPKSSKSGGKRSSWFPSEKRLELRKVASIQTGTSLFPGSYREKTPGTCLTIRGNDQDGEPKVHLEFASDTVAHFFRDGMQLVLSHALLMEKRSKGERTAGTSERPPASPQQRPSQDPPPTPPQPAPRPAPPPSAPQRPPQRPPQPVSSAPPPPAPKRKSAQPPGPAPPKPASRPPPKPATRPPPSRRLSSAIGGSASSAAQKNPPGANGPTSRVKQ